MMKKQKNSFPVWLANVKTKMKTVHKIEDSEELNDTLSLSVLRTHYANGLDSITAAKKYFEEFFVQ